MSTIANSLLGESYANFANDWKMLDLPLDRLINRADNRQIDIETVEKLAVSIYEDGLAQPIFVRPAGEDCYEIVAGQHRHAAFSKLKEEHPDNPKFKTIPAYVGDVDDQKAHKLMIATNLISNSLTKEEKDQAYLEWAEDVKKRRKTNKSLKGKTSKIVADEIKDTTGKEESQASVERALERAKKKRSEAQKEAAADYRRLAPDWKERYQEKKDSKHVAKIAALTLKQQTKLYDTLSVVYGDDFSENNVAEALTISNISKGSKPKDIVKAINKHIVEAAQLAQLSDELGFNTGVSSDQLFGLIVSGS